MTRLYQAFNHLVDKGDILVILCPTAFEAEKLFIVFERHDVRWCNTEPCVPNNTHHDSYGNETCYVVIPKSITKFELMFGDISGFIRQSDERPEFKHHTIVTANAFLYNPNLFPS